MKNLNFILILFILFANVTNADIVQTSQTNEKENQISIKPIEVKDIESYKQLFDPLNKQTEEAKTKGTQKLIKTIQKNPYKLKINTINYEELIKKLNKKIEINKKAKNNTAVIRDLILLQKYKTEEEINNILLYLIESFKIFSDVDEIKKTITKMTLQPKYEFFQNSLNLESESKIKEKAKDLLIDLKNKEQELKDIKKSILENIDLFFIKKETFVVKYKIDEKINKINEKFYILNRHLKNYHLDVGRITIFTITMIVFLLIGIFLNKAVLPLIRFIIIKKSQEDLKEDFLNSFESIKFPIIIIMMILGSEFAMEIVNYPKPLSQDTQKIFLFLYVFVTILIIYRILDILFLIMSNKGIFKNYRIELLNLGIRILKLIIALIGIFYFLHKLNIDTTKMWASLGIGSMAIAFASKDIIASFFSGLKLILDDAFSNGDWVELSTGEEGTIIDIGVINTRIRTFSNGLISIPNAQIAKNSFINWSRRKIGRKIGFKIGIEYNSKPEDIQQAINDLREYFEHHPKISPKNANFSKKRAIEGKLVSIGDSIGLKNTQMVHLDSFGDSAIIIDIYVFSKTVIWSEWRDLKEEVMFQIMDIIKKNNLSFAFPSQTIYLEKNLLNE